MVPAPENDASTADTVVKVGDAPHQAKQVKALQPAHTHASTAQLPTPAQLACCACAACG